MASEYKELRQLLKTHGLRTDITGGDHLGIYRGTTRIYTMGNSPKNAYHAIQNTVRDLVVNQQLPDNLVFKGRIYKRKRTPKVLHDRTI